MIFSTLKFTSSLLIASSLVMASPFPQKKNPNSSACPATKALTGGEKSCDAIAKEVGTDLATLLKLNAANGLNQTHCDDLKAGKFKAADLKGTQICVPK